MDDEVASHYIDMIDQTTLGHWFIEEKFTVTPRVGWQIDLFGHSAVQAYLLEAEVGFDSFFFGQIDYQDRDKRKNEKSHEVVWQGSKSFGSSAQSVSDSPAPFRSIFGFRYFNSLQSECFFACFLSHVTMVISAPTGSGKTVLFELCILRLLSRFIFAEGRFIHLEGNTQNSRLSTILYMEIFLMFI